MRESAYTEAAEPPSAPRAARSPSDLFYQATVATAEAALRLHETDRAKFWLEQAPDSLRGWEWRYLQGLSDVSSAVFAVDGSAINDVSVSPDGRFREFCVGLPNPARFFVQ